MEKPESRMPFQEQPCHMIIVDTLSPSPYVVQTFTKSLLRTVTLSASMRGAGRVAAVSALALGHTPTLSCPLLEPRGRLDQLAAALNQLTERTRLELRHGAVDEEVGRVEVALDMVTRQFDQFCSQPAQSGCQLQLTVLTADSDVISKLRLWGRTAADAARVQRVQVFQVLKFGDAAADDSDMDGDVASVPVVVTDTQGESETFDQYFQSWLLEQSTSSVHVRLLLPPLTAPLSLSCDMQAALVSPLSLPFTHRVLLTPEKTAWHAAARGEVAVHRLEVTGRAARAGVCQSHVHGEPVLLRPTACWQLDWQQLVVNRQRLRALCDELRSSDEVLLARLAVGRSRPEVSGRFMLLPAGCSDGDTLLVCALTPAELVLPPDDGAAHQSFLPPPPEVLEEVRQRLSGIGRHRSYNPLDHPSGLSEALSALSHKSPAQSQSEGGSGAAAPGARGGRGRGGAGGDPGARGGRGGARAGRSRARPLFWKEDWAQVLE